MSALDSDWSSPVHVYLSDPPPSEDSPWSAAAPVTLRRPRHPVGTLTEGGWRWGPRLVLTTTGWR